MPRHVQAICLALLCGCATAASPVAFAERQEPGRFRTVHVDSVEPGLVGQFEEARRAWLAVLASSRTSDARGVFLQVGDYTFLTLRPFATFSELDGRGQARARALAVVDPASRKRYDERTDATLVFPHRNEIWSLEGSLGYVAPEGPASECRAGAGRLVIESLRPAPPFESQYRTLWKEIRDGLEKARYPLSRITYASYFGDGRLFSFWIARSKEQLTAAPTIEMALVQTLGKDKASELTTRLAECVVGSESLDMLPRPDLSNPELCH